MKKLFKNKKTIAFFTAILAVLFASLFLIGPSVSIASTIDSEIDFYIKQQKEEQQSVKQGKEIFEQLLRHEVRQKGIKIPQYGSQEYQKILFEYADPAGKFRQQNPQKWKSIDAYAFDYYERNNIAATEPPKEALQKGQTDVRVQNGTYNRSGAVNYAYKYVGNENDNPFYKNYNPAYYKSSSDCTNFVSQALKEGGGIPIVDAWWRFWFDKDDWYYYRKGTDNFDSKNDDSWSWSWTKASTLYSNIKSRLGAEVSSPDKLEVGDIVQFDFNKDGIWDHSAIVTSIDYSSVKKTRRVTYHTSNKKDILLTDPSLSSSNKRYLHITY